MNRNGMLYLAMAVLLLCVGCSRGRQSAITNEDREEAPYTYIYQEGARYRLVTERRLQFVFPDQTTIFMKAEQNIGNGRITCEIEPAGTEERNDNISLGTASEIQAVYVCCEEDDFILAVVRQMDLGMGSALPQTAFISLGTREQVEVSGSFQYEREGLYTKTEECLGISLIRHVSCGTRLTVEETVETLENQYMTKRPMVILLMEDDHVQAEDFLNTDDYFILPAGTSFTVIGEQIISDNILMTLRGYIIRAELADKAVTGCFLLNAYDQMLLQDAALTSVVAAAGAEPSVQVSSADVVTGSLMYNIINVRISPEQKHELLLIDYMGYPGSISTDEELLQSSDAAEEKFTEILSGYTEIDVHADDMRIDDYADRMSVNKYTDSRIVSLPEGAEGVSVDGIYMQRQGRLVIAVTCIYANGGTTTQFYTDFLGKIVALHMTEQAPDGMLVSAEEELQLPVRWYQKWDMGSSDAYDVLQNDTKLRQGRLVLMQDGYTAEYMFMGADLLVRVK